MHVTNCHKNYKSRVWKTHIYTNSFFTMDLNNSKKNLPKLIKIVFPHNYSSIALIEIIHSSFGTKKLSFVVHF